MVTCPKCGRPVSGRARSCGYCGESLVNEYFSRTPEEELPQSERTVGALACMVLGILGAANAADRNQMVGHDFFDDHPADYLSDDAGNPAGRTAVHGSRFGLAVFCSHSPVAYGSALFDAGSGSIRRPARDSVSADPWKYFSRSRKHCRDSFVSETCIKNVVQVLPVRHFYFCRISCEKPAGVA